MELGNLIFGNSRGMFEVPRGTLWEGKIYELLELIDDKWPSSVSFENNIFKIQPYYWGDCTCGYENREWEWCANNKHAQNCYQTDLRRLEVEFDALGKREFGEDRKEWEKRAKTICQKHGIPWNEGRGCKVHCTCDYKDRWHKFLEEDYHSETCPIIQPNFLYKPTGFTIDWYKYPLRDSYMNQELTYKEFREIINKCIESLEELNATK